MSEQIAKLNIEEKLIACIEMEQKRQDDIRALRAENARLRSNLVNCAARLEAYYGEDYPAVRDAKAALQPKEAQP